MKIAAILPAFNEAQRVKEVIKAVMRAPSIDEIVVVNDGSSDNTAEVVSAISGVKLVNLPVNKGKGAAMIAGFRATDADILVFLDADLMGLKPEHVEALVAPVKSRRYEMALGSFRGGRWLTSIAQKVNPNISGQRAIRRGTFEQIPGIEHSRYGVEMAITKFCRSYRVKTQTVIITGVTHPMKEEKLGFVRGALSRMRMYFQIIKIRLDPRKPRRMRPPMSRPIPRLLKRAAANQRRQGQLNAAAYWLYRQERKWHKKREEGKSHARWRKDRWE